MAVYSVVASALLASIGLTLQKYCSMQMLVLIAVQMAAISQELSVLSVMVLVLLAAEDRMTNALPAFLISNSTRVRAYRFAAPANTHSTDYVLAAMRTVTTAYRLRTVISANKMQCSWGKVVSSHPARLPVKLAQAPSQHALPAPQISIFTSLNATILALQAPTQWIEYAVQSMRVSLFFQLQLPGSSA
jgi:hypothetical protein